MPAAFSVEEMQQYLNEFQPRHYSKDGKQPLLYAAVLVLSLQFHAAVDFLVNDPTAMHSHGTDAVHICIAMHQDGLLETAQPVPGVAPEGAMRLRPAAVVHAYASQQFLSRQRGDNHVEAALEYFIAGEKGCRDVRSSGQASLKMLHKRTTERQSFCAGSQRPTSRRTLLWRGRSCFRSW